MYDSYTCSISQHLVHNLVVGRGQHQIHGMHVLGELEVAGMLTVSGLAEDIAGRLRFLDIQRSNRNPAGSSDAAVIVTLVLVLWRKAKCS